jgi:hypothetical protein
MKLLGKSAISVVACILLSGCGLLDSSSNMGQSEAFKLGYSHASELGFEKIDNEYSAYAACTTMGQSLFSTNSQDDFDEYVAGCMVYVLP